MSPFPPKLGHLALMLSGDWESPNPGYTCAEHWAEVGDVLYGVAFMGGSFELLKVDVVGGRVRYVARPNGGPEVVFPLASLSPKTVTFANPEHDQPQVIEYRVRLNNKIRTRSETGGKWSRLCSLAFVETPSAPEILAAERALSSGREATLSGISPDGAFGFTIGTWNEQQSATQAAAYATVWRQDESGRWSAVSDAVDPVD